VRTAHQVWSERDGVLLRLEDEAGGVGFGECAPIPEFGTETADEAEAICRELGAQVDERRLDAIPTRLGCLRQAVTSARLDLEASSDTGAEADKRHLAVAALLPAGKAALSRVAALGEIGFRIFKWKVGIADIGEELPLLDDLCAALPGGAKLRLDANGAWDRRKAERWLERCAERPIEYVEQPCLAQARDGETAVRRAEDLLLGLAGEYPTPIGLDESLVGDGDVQRWLGAGWPGVFVIKPLLLGNVEDALERLAKAKAQVVFSSALETAVGSRRALRLAFAWTGEPRALGFGVWPLFQDSRFDGPAAAPFLRRQDIERLDPSAVWAALG
jgi:o-succinylbenzoate synthase